MPRTKDETSISSKCCKLKVSYVVVKAAMNRGLTFDEAVAHARSIGFFDGHQQHRSKDMYYTAYNVNSSIVKFRELHDWDAADIIKTPVKGIAGNRVTYRNKEYASQSAVCREYGISTRFIDRLMRDYDYDFLPLFTFTESYFRQFRPNKEPMSRCPYVIVGTEWYWTKSELAIALGINESVLGSAFYKHDYDMPRSMAYLNELYGIPTKFLCTEITPCYRQFYGMLTTLVDSGMLEDLQMWLNG